MLFGMQRAHVPMAFLHRILPLSGASIFRLFLSGIKIPIHYLFFAILRGENCVCLSLKHFLRRSQAFCDNLSYSCFKRTLAGRSKNGGSQVFETTSLRHIVRHKVHSPKFPDETPTTLTQSLYFSDEHESCGIDVTSNASYVRVTMLTLLR